MMTAKKRRVWVWIFLPVVPVAVLVLPGLYLYRDEPLPPDDDLRLLRVEVPAHENGFRLVDLREEDVDFPYKEYDACAPFRETWDRQVVDRVLAKNEEVLRKYDECMELPKFQVPIPRNGYTSFFAIAWRISNLAGARLGALFEDGRQKEAFAEAKKLLRFGARIEGSQGSLLTYLVVRYIKSDATETLTRMLTRATLTGEDLRPFFEDLLEYRGQETTLRDVLKTEYGLMYDTVDALGRGDPVAGFQPLWYSRLFFKPNQTKRLLAEAYQQVIEGCAEADLKELSPWWPPNNFAGRTLVSSVKPLGQILWNRKRIADFHVIVPYVLFAMKRFKADKGRLPDRLAELVPGYLLEIPADPFDGKPIRYSREKRLIYSIGSDLVDSGGVELEEEWPWKPEEPTYKFGL